jgi:CheY-like chemotaxis protein
LNVLVAEDNPTNLILVTRLLEKKGYSVLAAENGRKALTAFGDQKFDLIVMDIQMPEMNGLEASAAIREIEKRSGSHTPILALTAHTAQEDRDRCLAAGMDHFISKPIYTSDFMNAIDQLMSRSAPDRPNQAQCDETGEPEPWFDRQGLMERCDDDVELLREAAEIFRRSHPNQIEELRAAMARGDRRAAERAAHTIKGTVGNLGGISSMEAALRLEEMARSGDLQKAPDACDVLGREIERLLAALAALVQKDSSCEF